MPIEPGEVHRPSGWASGREERDRLGGTILAAGLGRRLEPLTARYIPKPLFPLGGKAPMVEAWVRKLVASGISDLSMNLCVLKETIRGCFGDGARYGARLSYVDEETPTGTLGGVCKQALGRDAKVLPGEAPLTNEPFRGSTVIAPSGDIVTNVGPDQLEELYDIHQRVGAALTMVLVPIAPERRKDFGTAILRQPESRTGVLSSSGRIIEFREKDPDSPSVLNNASIYFIDLGFLKELDALRTPAKLGVDRPFYDFGKQVFPALLGKLPHVDLSRNNLLWGVQYDGAWFDVGQKRDYLTVNEQVLDGRLDFAIPYEKRPWGHLGANVSIDLSRTKIVPPVVIGNDCTIEPGATLGPYAVIGDGWTIGRDAKVSRSVLWERYPMVRADGSQLSMDEMRRLDPHRIAAGVSITDSIVAGGDIRTSVSASTVVLDDDGNLEVTSIDASPDGPRV